MELNAINTLLQLLKGNQNYFNVSCELFLQKIAVVEKLKLALQIHLKLTATVSLIVPLQSQAMFLDNKQTLPSLNEIQVPPSCGISLSSSLQKLDTAMWRLFFGKWSIIRMFKVEDPWCVLRESVTNRDESSLGGKSQGFLHPTLEHILPHILPTSTIWSWVTFWEYYQE